jgi:hypothetical protein
MLDAASWKFLDRVIKGATGADVQVEVDDGRFTISGDRESVLKARKLMDKVVGLRLERMEDDGKGTSTVIYVDVR